MNKPDYIIALARNERKSVCDHYRYYRYLKANHFKTSENAYKLNALYFLGTCQPMQLALLFRVSFWELERAINQAEYTQHFILKRNGDKRLIYAPAPELKLLQKRLNYFLQAYYLWIKPLQVYGFTIHQPKRERLCNIAENAAMHTAKKFILNIDLKDFFPSITAKRVRDMFLSPLFGFNTNIATALTLLTTYKGCLPTGAPTSPAISNFMCLKLDEDLENYALSTGLTYTRYADDLTFSSDTFIDKPVLHKIIGIIIDNDFMLNPRKLHFSTSGKRQTVTGLTVNTRVNVSRKMLKNTRAMLFDLQKNGLEAATCNHFELDTIEAPHFYSLFLYRLKGYIDFIGQVRGREDALYVKMVENFRRDNWMAIVS